MDNSNVELITKMVLEAVEKKNAAQSGEGFLVPIGVSARHIHLTQEHVEILFGGRLPSYKMSKNLWVDSLHKSKRLQLLVLN